MRPEEVFAFTAQQRAELEAGWVAMVTAQEAAAIQSAVPVLERAAAAALRPRGRVWKAYAYVARFAGPLLITTVVASTGAAIGLAFVAAR
ncbi:hypothetical protein [Streptomyces sp. NPDC008265]|uniref:hypothetical protein n=1 Tax=Streptomyces sp. NPDC008265 TaxID=3364824 RepID=UPI0036E1E5BA